MVITKTERKEFYKKQLQKYKTKEEKINYLEELKFLTDMIDRWTEFDRVSYDAILELLDEVKNEKFTNNI